MKKFTRLLIALIMTITAMGAWAQNELDALRYSFREPFGSARFMAMGGAFGALGGDLGSLTWNPAGLGVYRRNDIGLTVGVSGFNTNAAYNDANTNANEFAFHLPNIGLAVAHRTDDPDWTFVNYAVGFSKVINFNRRFTVRGDAVNTTLLDVFANQANGTPFDQVNDAFPFGAGMAWETFLLDPIPNTSDQYMTAIPFGQVTQEMTVETSGHMSETVVAMGTNYLDRLYLGGTIGFPTVRFSQSMTYREFNLDPTLELDDYTYAEDLVTSGNGINIKLGAIVRATTWLRLGAAWHSRTSIRLNDVWDTRMISRFRDGDQYSEGVQGAYDYRISIPSRLILSSAFFLGRDGVISADYEFVDYGSAELRPASFMPNGYDFASENTAVANLFRASHNVRVGAEWRILSVYRARAGLIFQQDPYVTEATNFNTHMMTYSFGGGYRGSKFYAEMAYMLRMGSQDFYIYDPSLVNPAELRGRKGEFMVTIGLRY